MDERHVSRMPLKYDGVVTPAFAALLERYGATPDLARIAKSGTAAPATQAPIAAHPWTRYLNQISEADSGSPLFRGAVGSVIAFAIFLVAILIFNAPTTYLISASAATGEVTGDSTALQPFVIDDVSGEAIELRPGGTGYRIVQLRNPNSVAILVESLSATPGQPLTVTQERLKGCPPGVLYVTPIIDKLYLPANSTTSIRMTVRVSESVPDDCSNAVFPITYTGRAKAAD